MRAFLLALPLALALAACGEKEAPKTGGGPAKSGDTSKAAEPAKSAAPKHPWASFKPGSFAKLKSTTVMEIAGTKNENVSETKTTLVEVTSDKAVVEMEMTVAGNAMPKQKMDMPLKAPEGTAKVDGPKPKTGSEEVEAAGKKFKCTWTETESEQAGTKSVTKVWQSEDVPGHTVKMTMNSTGASNMTMTQTLVEYAAK